MHDKLLKTIVVGYDGSEPARDGLALARSLGLLLDAEVVAVSILTFAPTEANWNVYEQLQREERERLTTEARDGLQGVASVEALAIPGASPARELERIAETRPGDLLVLGSTHRGPVGRVLPGTVADRLMAGAPCPLAIAPRAYADAERRVQRIGVGCDGSSEAARALELAAALAAVAGASVELLAVADPEEPLEAREIADDRAAAVSDQERLDRGRGRMLAAAESAAASLPEGIERTISVLEGDPRTELVDASGRLDLLAIGSRGYGPVGRVLLGGVSSAVVRAAACPVLVAPRSAAGVG